MALHRCLNLNSTNRVILFFLPSFSLSFPSFPSFPFSIFSILGAHGFALSIFHNARLRRKKEKRKKKEKTFRPHIPHTSHHRGGTQCAYLHCPFRPPSQNHMI
ncbi:hypothetical protein HOY82DRAFT_67184 [Tuber indicum]|nr:hypothetical protein HOY82DRAFT_67184 [Tuber indicum]